MEFLPLAVLLVWSIIACFLPMKEKRLQVIMGINALLVALALMALAVPVIGGAPVQGGMLIVDPLRGLLVLPLALSWVVTVCAFALWWGACFAKGIGERQLFLARSGTLVGGFVGLLLALFANGPLLLVIGLFLTFFFTCVSALFHAPAAALSNLRTYVTGIGAAYLFFALGNGVLFISSYRAMPFGTLLGVVMFGFSLAWFLGLLPGMAWFRKGTMALPRAQRVLMRAFLPAALLPHMFVLPTWIGAEGGTFVQNMLLVLAFFALLALAEQLRARESVAESLMVLLMGLVLVSGGYGLAGAIPALMFVLVLVLFGTLLILAQEGAWWSMRTKKYVALIFAGMPIISPLFVPYALSVGYGVQMRPIAACIAAAVVVYAAYVLSMRVLRAWSEAEAQPVEKWMSNISLVLLGAMTIYGVWFLYADALAILVDAVEIAQKE